MKCILCDTRKGKRFCPAKNTSICPQCCGEKRVVEIACPSDCVYLRSGQSYQSGKKYVAQLLEQDDPVRRRKFYETSRRFPEVIYGIEEAIVRFARGVRAFTDEQALEVIALLKDTYRTEEKGLIYEHTSSNPLVQSLLREVRKMLEERRFKMSEGAPLLRMGEVLDCLEVVGADIQYHLQHGAEKGSYLSFITQNHPSTRPETPSSGLIYPG